MSRPTAGDTEVDVGANAIAVVLMICALGLAVPAAGAGARPAASGGDRDGWYWVTDFGAKGDGVADDTRAFQKAIDKASARGGYVLVPPVGPGRGYVVTRTVKLPRGVSLIGSPAGFANDAWAAFDLPEKVVHGAKILARPARSEYATDRKRPLFELDGGNTVRGFWIMYDQQPWPTDEQFKDPKSPFHYPSLDKAREGFIRDHVKPCGPTFYLNRGAVNVVIQEVSCDRYYDFYFQVGGGKNLVDRVYLYGYKRGFVIRDSYDVNRLSSIHLCPNVGPASPGPVGPGKSYSWIYGIIVSKPDCVGIQLGRSDGYCFRDLFLFGVHTGVRFGASVDYPLVDPVEGVSCFHDPTSDRFTGFLAPYNGGGPWGYISTLTVDCCAQGIQLVWPSTACTCLLTNCFIGTAFIDGREFAASSGSGNLVSIARQTPFAIEETYRAANNAGSVPAFMCSNLEFASYGVPDRFAGSSAHVNECNGRGFLIGGEVTMELTNVRMNWPYDNDHVYAVNSHAGRYSVRIRGLIQAGEPKPDMVIDTKGMR